MPERTPKTKRVLKPQKEGGPKIVLPVAEQIIGMFYGTHCMEAGHAIAHWIHTPDCSSAVRELIRDALMMDGTTAHNKDAQYLFKCPTCCDSKRIALGGEWVDCPSCNPIKMPACSEWHSEAESPKVIKTHLVLEKNEKGQLTPTLAYKICGCWKPTQGRDRRVHPEFWAEINLLGDKETNHAGREVIQPACGPWNNQTADKDPTQTWLVLEETSEKELRPKLAHRLADTWKECGGINQTIQPKFWSEITIPIPIPTEPCSN